MASVPISGLAALGAAPAANDIIPFVDVSDTAQAPTGTTKKMTVANLFTAPTISTSLTLSGFAVVSGNVDIGGTLDVIGAATIGGTVSSGVTSGAAFNAVSATTGEVFERFINTGGALVMGIESSVGGAIIPASAAYAAVVASFTATSLHLGTNGAIRLTINSAGAATFSHGVTIASGTLAVAGAITGGSATAAIASSVALDNGAGAFTATLTNAPKVGNPSKWIPINDNGTITYVPGWVP